MTTLRKCFLLAVVASGALLLSARDASACWSGGYRTGCYYQTYSYPACYGYAYQPSYTYTYRPYHTYTYTYQPSYTYPAWYVGHRLGWRLFR
jgi:hypothetical protein